METAEIMEAARALYLACLKEKTLRHAEEVAQTASRLAKAHHLDPEKVRLAVLLHDISVVLSPDEMYETVVSRGLPVDPAEEKYHFLLHQRLSRIIAEERFGVRDGTVLSAVECHTTLRKGSGPVDQAVFIADKISWDREGRPPYHDFLMELAVESLEQACLWYIQYQFDHQLLLMPHRWITEAYEDLKERAGGTFPAECGRPAGKGA